MAWASLEQYSAHLIGLTCGHRQEFGNGGQASARRSRSRSFDADCMQELDLVVFLKILQNSTSHKFLNACIKY
jgi:hypothetical protein